MEMREIEKAVSEVMQVPIEAMHGKTRKREVVWARQLTWKYAKATRPRKSLSQLAGYFGKDHATAIWGIKSMSSLIETDREANELWTEVLNRLPIHPNFDDYILRVKGRLSEEQLRQFCNNVSQL